MTERPRVPRRTARREGGKMCLADGRTYTRTTGQLLHTSRKCEGEQSTRVARRMVTQAARRTVIHRSLWTHATIPHECYTPRWRSARYVSRQRRGIRARTCYVGGFAHGSWARVHTNGCTRSSQALGGHRQRKSSTSRIVVVHSYNSRAAHVGKLCVHHVTLSETTER